MSNILQIFSEKIDKYIIIYVDKRIWFILSLKLYLLILTKNYQFKVQVIPKFGGFCFTTITIVML